MSSPSVAIGTESAPSVPITSQSVATPATQLSNLKELLDIIRARGEKNVPMLRTTAVRLSEFTNKSIGDIRIDELVNVRLPFRVYLKERRYSDNSVRTYCHNVQRLLRWAEELGWISSKQSVEDAWKPLFDAFRGNPRAYAVVAAFAIQNGTMPSEFSNADLEAWGESMLRTGRQYKTIRQAKWQFRKAVIKAGLEKLLPNLELNPHKTWYKVRTSELPEPLRSETRDLLAWKQARFAKGRPQWMRHRAVSAEQLENCICRLYGYARNIGNFDNISTLLTLFREEVVTGFVEWGLNERKLTKSSLLRLSMLYGAMRYHPKYKNNDYGWFSTLFDEVPEDDRSVAQEKKAKKFVPLQMLRKIPEVIRKLRMKIGSGGLKESRLAHDELLILWMTTLPWRQRNIRECRLGDPETANLFFGPLPTLVHIAKPKWVDDALKQNPDQCFWQFFFREAETKTGCTVRGILPRCLIPLLEEYLDQHRPRLVSKPDPGTLFLNHDGAALGWQIMTYHVSEIVLKYTRRRMNPHLFRDAFAYAWLESHPEDYLTLSKCLWHASIKYTLSVYGKNFDESNGARRIDEWLSDGVTN